MASNGTRVPAWRRLGLALKNEDQSASIGGTEISPSNLPQVKSRDAQTIAPNETHVRVAQTSKGKEEKLGKRKHRSESRDRPADDDDQTSKKRKQSHDLDHTDAAAVTSISPTEAPEIVDPTQTARPKGDPNYRKKKEKPNKRRNDQTAAAQPSKPIKAPKNSFPEKADREVLLASTETVDNDLEDSKLLSTPRTDRRKSVAFTPDTKTVDGHTGQDLFKKWVAEQKGAAQTNEEPASSPSKPEKKSEKKPEKKSEKKPIAPAVPTNNQPSESASTSKPFKSTAETPKPKKKDHSAYISYLTQYHTDRDNWKFNKAKQNDVIDNALNIFRIPSQHSEALFEYIAGLKGAGVIERLKERCTATLKDLAEQESKSATSMNDQEARDAMKQEALQEGLKKGKKRRMIEADAEDLANHPAGDAHIRHMQRERAEALLMHLGRTAPVLPAVQTNGINPSMKHLAPPVRDARKRKRRTDISSDEESSSSESESDSDSDDSSDSDSDSGSDAGSDTSSSGGSSNSSDSDSDSDSDSSGGANSDDDSSGSDASDSGSADNADSDSDDSSSDSG